MNGLLQHDIWLIVGGTGYTGWTEIEIDRGIDSMVGSFNLRLASKEETDAQDWPIEEGASCVIKLNGTVLITGYIDSVTRMLDPEQRGISVRGRDKAADLVDCSAIHSPGSWQNRSLQAIAAELVKPFGITLDIAQDTGAPFKKFALQQGETVFAAIERMARYRGLVCWSPGDGTLRVGNPDTGLRTGRLTEGSNVISASGSRDVQDRFSDYIVRGQASGDDSRSGAAVAQVSGKATDPAITRYRPMLIIGEEQSDRASLKKRAEWEAAVRSGRARPSEITVPGWLADDGEPFHPGRRSACNVPGAQIVGDMLIERVRLVKDAERGTLTDLTVVPPEAWTQLAQPEGQS